MAEVKLNDNGRIVNGSLTVNDKGVIKGVDSMNVYINIVNEIIQFPGKESCILNLDRSSMMTPYTFGYSSAFLPASKGFQFTEVKGNGVWKKDLAGYITNNNTDDNANGVNVTSGAAGGNPYWYLGSGFSGMKVQLAEAIKSSFTFQVCFMPFHNNTAWNEIALIGGNNDNDRIRLEMTDNANQCCFYSDNAAYKDQIQNMGTINISRTERNWIACSFDPNTKKFTRYTNGKPNGSVVINGSIPMGNDIIGLNTNKRMGNIQWTNHIRYYSIRIFNSCLSDEEIANLAKIDFMYK